MRATGIDSLLMGSRHSIPCSDELDQVRFEMIRSSAEVMQNYLIVSEPQSSSNS